jgi:hypothetical protein
MESTETFVRAAGRASLAGGALGLASLAAVLGGETTLGMDEFAGSGLAVAAGWAGFVAAGLLVVGLLGVAVRHVGDLSAAGRTALLVLGFATAVTVGAASTMALVVPTLADRAPELIENPPTAIPPTFIFSGLVMGVCGLVVMTGLRRAGLVSRGVGWLLGVGSVVAILPLPSRFFLLAFAVGVVALASTGRAAVPAGAAGEIEDRQGMDPTGAPVG